MQLIPVFARRRLWPASVLAGLMLLSNVTAAQDLPGAKDNPLLKRFAGSTIVGYDYKRFDEYLVPTGTYKGYDTIEKAQLDQHCPR